MSNDSRDSRILDCTASGFIKRFFATSRLHHLSTWKADLADYVIGQMNSNNRSSAVAMHKSSHPDDPFRTIMHVDMDCFFASVGVRDRPHLVGKPVAVAHSQGGVSLDYSTSEIASCNYEARAKGVKNGVFIGSAKELAPDLVIIPYEFEKYDACSKALYHTLLGVADFVQSVSIDEAFIDVTFCVQKRLLERTNCRSLVELGALGAHTGSEDVWKLHEEAAISVANHIRATIFSRTQCQASVGIGNNLLLARMATQKAKPNGAFSLLHRDTAVTHLSTMPIRSLPGVGRSLSEKCEQMQLHTCGDVQSAFRGATSATVNATFLQQLRKELGEKTGENLHSFCWGLDDRVLENKPRQSVGADINWGIRFTTAEQVDAFLRDFSEEVYARLDRSGNIAKQVTVDVKKKLYEGEPGKFLGCGHCLDLSKSMIPGRAIASAEALYKCVSTLYKEINLQPLDVRGIGIHLRKLQQSSNSSGATTSGIGAGAGAGNITGFFSIQRKDADKKPHTHPPPLAVKQDSGGSNHTRGHAVGHTEEDGEDSHEGDEEEQECQHILDANKKSNQFNASAHNNTNTAALYDREPLRNDVKPMLPSSGAKPAQEPQALVTQPNPKRAGTQPTVSAAAVHSLLQSPSTGTKDCTIQSTQCPAENPRSAVTRGTDASAAAVLSMDDIDLEVFAALPEEIQRELQREFEHRAQQSAIGSQPARTVKPAASSKRAVVASSVTAKSNKRAKNVEQKVIDAVTTKQGTLDMWRVSK